MKTLLIFAGLFGFGHLNSQDIKGAYLRTKQISGNNTYSITLTLFTDSSSSISRPTASINFGDGTSSNFTSAATSFYNETKVTTYSGVHAYSGPGLYLISYLDSFRVASINNLLNSGTAKIYIESLLNLNSQLGINSSPSISFLPPTRGAKGGLLSYNGGFNDVDGDSLSFALVNGSGNGYYIPSSASLNSITGTFDFIPDTAGLYLFAIEISEWRKNTNSMYQNIAASRIEFSIDIDETVGLADAGHLHAHFTLYPNPTSGLLYLSNVPINADMYSVTVVNALGQTIRRSEFSEQINVEDLERGLYKLIIHKNGINIRAKTFVKY